MSEIKEHEKREVGAPIPEWKKELQEMMSKYHFSFLHLQQFMEKTIEEEIRKGRK